MKQLRDDPFCHMNEFAGLEGFPSTHASGIMACLEKWPRGRGFQIVTASFGPQGLTEPIEVLESEQFASELNCLSGACLFQDILLFWKMDEESEDWSILEAWQVQGRARRRVWHAKLRDEAASSGCQAVVPHLIHSMSCCARDAPTCIHCSESGRL